MEKRRSQMAISIEDSNGQHTYRQGSLISRTGSHNGSDNGLSRRCSRHSHVSKRSSLGSTNHGGGVTTGMTTADVVVTVSSQQMQPPPVSPRGSGPACMAVDIERRLSQLSDTEVEQVVAVAIEEASRRNSNASFHRRVSPQVSLNVPVPSNPPCSTTGALLAPPTAEMVAQRRFSEVSAAIERHNSRRQAKRSQSVMYRNKRRASRRNSEVRHSPTEFGTYQQVPTVTTTVPGQAL